MKIIDNFLSQDVFSELKHVMSLPDFPWFWNDNIVEDKELLCDELDNYQLTHSFVHDGVQKSDWYPMLLPILRKTDCKALIRAKANLNPRTSEIIQSAYHTDFDNCTTAIFYLNTCNGYTLFKNGERVSSVENRMLFFDSSLQHTGTSCTDSKRRMVINFNYT